MDVFNLDSRRRVYEFVQARPGMHLRGIARGLTMPLGTALYHLDCLERSGHLVVRQDGRYKRFFAKDALGRREKDYVAVLHHAVPRRLLAVLLARGKRTQRELAREVGASRSTVSFHLGNLVRQGILLREEGWPEGFYVPAEPELASRILAGQGNRFGDALVDGLIATLPRPEPAPPATAS